MKRQWHPSRLNSRPNVIIGANAHVCVNKFADYFDVEARVIPVSETRGYVFGFRDLEVRLDENTSIKSPSRVSLFFVSANLL
jgi:glutamate decarboxylase